MHAWNGSNLQLVQWHVGLVCADLVRRKREAEFENFCFLFVFLSCRQDASVTVFVEKMHIQHEGNS